MGSCVGSVKVNVWRWLSERFNWWNKTAVFWSLILVFKARLPVSIFNSQRSVYQCFICKYFSKLTASAQWGQDWCSFHFLIQCAHMKCPRCGQAHCWCIDQQIEQQKPGLRSMAWFFKFCFYFKATYNYSICIGSCTTHLHSACNTHRWQLWLSREKGSINKVSGFNSCFLQFALRNVLKLSLMADTTVFKWCVIEKEHNWVMYLWKHLQRSVLSYYWENPL